MTPLGTALSLALLGLVSTAAQFHSGSHHTSAHRPSAHYVTAQHPSTHVTAAHPSTQYGAPRVITATPANYYQPAGQQYRVITPSAHSGNTQQNYHSGATQNYNSGTHAAHSGTQNFNSGTHGVHSGAQNFHSGGQNFHSGATHNTHGTAQNFNTGTSTFYGTAPSSHNAANTFHSSVPTAHSGVQTFPTSAPSFHSTTAPSHNNGHNFHNSGSSSFQPSAPSSSHGVQDTRGSAPFSSSSISGSSGISSPSGNSGPSRPKLVGRQRLAKPGAGQSFDSRKQLRQDVRAIIQGSTKYYLSWADGSHRTYTWDEADHECRRYGLRLVSLTSFEKEAEISKLLNSAPFPVAYYWTSATKQGPNGGFMWADRNQTPVCEIDSPSDVCHENWGRVGQLREPQPDNAEGHENCLAVLNRFYPGDGITWHDIACHHKKHFVCEAF